MRYSSTSVKKSSGNKLLFACGALSVFAWLLFFNQPSETTEREANQVAANVTEFASVPSLATSGEVPDSQPETRYVDIEEIAVGMRVVAQNPEVLDEERSRIEEPNQSSWRKLTLEMKKIDGTDLSITLLRSIEWIKKKNAKSGEFVLLDLPEINACGNAKITSIEDCPKISSRKGQVVTGTFRHSTAGIFDISVEGEAQPIGTTGPHPFWNVTRDKFVPADELNVGELLFTKNGTTAAIESIIEREKPYPVYNIEVHGEHVYHVGETGLLVHNSAEADGYLKYLLAHVKKSKGGVSNLAKNATKAVDDVADDVLKTSSNKTASDFARNWQGAGSYPGVDLFRDITLKKGTVIFGGVPGQSNFYTTASALRRSRNNAESFFQGLQVSPHPQYGYRPGVTAYEVIQDIPAAFGKTLANPHHGKGGLPQIVIENFEDFLRPIYSIPLK